VSRERDPDHRRGPAPFEPPPPESEPNPDRIRRERPSGMPAEPRDPLPHPDRPRASARRESMKRRPRARRPRFVLRPLRAFVRLDLRGTRACARAVFALRDSRFTRPHG